MDKRDSIIAVVTSPLGFFALALLIIEGFLGIIIVGSGDTLTPLMKFSGVWIATAAFGLVVVLVALMVWLIPDHLTYRGTDWLEKMRVMKSWSDETSPTTKKEVEELPQVNDPA